GICATFIILLAQILLHMNFSWIKLPKTKILIVRDVDKENYQSIVEETFMQFGINIRDVSIDRDAQSKLRKYTFTIEIPQNIMEEDIISSIEYNASLKSSM
ncbi:MAG: hypothetical protein IJZ81_02810, partial [Clostridia bacterium]|nr:hypothetical protein [Clostridia bacterium]